MKQQQQQQQRPPKNDYGITGIFPIPVYRANRHSNLDPTEKAELEDIIKSGMMVNKEVTSNNNFSRNTYVFETKLANLKEFCEKHIRIYVKEILGVVEKENEGVTFHITQSWLNITKPGKIHAAHWHPNSIISGVFYISIKEEDEIMFHQQSDQHKMKHIILIEPTHYNLWNSDISTINVGNNELLLFPAWLNHQVKPNEKSTTDRISLAFNVFPRGRIGVQGSLNELIL